VPGTVKKDREHAKKMGAVDYITKPSTQDELLKKIAKFIKAN